MSPKGPCFQRVSNDLTSWPMVLLQVYVAVSCLINYINTSIPTSTILPLPKNYLNPQREIKEARFTKKLDDRSSSSFFSHSPCQSMYYSSSLTLFIHYIQNMLCKSLCMRHHLILCWFHWNTMLHTVLILLYVALIPWFRSCILNMLKLHIFTKWT